jgi:hypothetical protein
MIELMNYKIEKNLLTDQIIKEKELYQQLNDLILNSFQDSINSKN